MKFFILTIIFFFSVLNNSTLIAATVLGTGSGALLGNDLTDPEDNGVDSGTNGSNFNWTSINASSQKTFVGESSYNVFDNNVGSGSDKWCCGDQSKQLQDSWIYVQLSQSYVLSHFTITSGNDVAGRDPDIWKIQGSNDGSNWTDIYSYSNDGNSPFSARLQVIKYTGAGDDFATPDSYSYFRYYVTSSVSGGHQINELEFFGDADSTAPTLSSSTPANNATGVAVDSNIVLNFSENVDAESGGTITIKKTTGNAVVETIDVTDTDIVTGTGTSQITITPSSNFDNNTEYYVLIAGTAFDDSSSNSYAGISSTTALSFTTVNAVPTLSSSVPADDATDVERDANIILNFSENVDAETGDIEIYKTSGDVLVETIGVTSGQVSGSGTSQITINPSSNFDAETEYYVLIDATAFDDSDSGSYAGISSTTALSFTIKAMVDPTTDKDVTGTIDAQNMMAKTTLTEFTSIVNDRLRYLRQNRINKDFTKNNIKLDFGNAMLTSLAKFIPESKIHLTNEILTSLAIDIPTSKTYLTNTMLTSLAKVTPASKVYLTDYVPKNWSSWSEGSVSMTKVGDSKNSSSKDIDVQSLALGFDKKLNNNNLLGFAMQFSQSDTEVGNNGTGINSKNYNLSVYRTRPLNDDNFVEGLFGVVLIESDLKRVSGANTLTGSRNGTQIFGSINYGKTLEKEDFNLTPIARVDLGYTELDGYTETGTDALTYGKQTVESGLATIGLEINDVVKFSNSSLKPFGSFQYGLDFSNSSDAKMNYTSDTSTIYTYTTGINSTHLLTAEMGFNYELQDHLKLTGILKRIQGSESQQTNNVRFGFHYISQRETEYAMSLDGYDELMTGLNISKKINGLDLKMSSNYNFLSEVPDYSANIEVSTSF